MSTLRVDSIQGQTAGTDRYVVQVVADSANADTQVTTSSYTDIGLSASITPSSANNKILITVHLSTIAKFGGDTSLSARLLRDSTSVIVFEGLAGDSGGTGSNAVGGSGTTFLDSPATTSSVTYKVQIINNTGNGTVRVHQSAASDSTMTLMEIAQ